MIGFSSPFATQIWTNPLAKQGRGNVFTAVTELYAACQTQCSESSFAALFAVKVEACIARLSHQTAHPA